MNTYIPFFKLRNEKTHGIKILVWIWWIPVCNFLYKYNIILITIPRELFFFYFRVFSFFFKITFSFLYKIRSEVEEGLSDQLTCASRGHNSAEDRGGVGGWLWPPGTRGLLGSPRVCSRPKSLLATPKASNWKSVLLISDLNPSFLLGLKFLFHFLYVSRAAKVRPFPRRGGLCELFSL